MNEKENSLRTIFVEAVEITDEAERAACLHRACGSDAALRQRVERLLKAHDEEGGFTSAVGQSSLVPPFTEKPGDRIGRYKLREQIGEGGCGVVYVAEQEEPVRRRVALKVIKLGMDTRSVVARFEAERQALAMMDHPNIARVLDAGATDTGRPYFVMELVRGIRITDYCDQNTLSTKQRLELFTQVCRAIQHAHQKGIIHRDIKPSNVLVAVDDGVPAPKVIDFGIAKATEGRLTDLTVHTELHQFIGTPAYMSPEQAEGNRLDIDTRSDIYSLGVLLYELLTGKTPFDAKQLLTAGLDEMRRTIREVEPIKPSTRLTRELVAVDVRRPTSQSKVGGPATEMDRASSRRLPQTRELIALLRGDLDSIVMKCLEKDRSRRYESANGLAMDVQRHLDKEPVLARPPSRLYRFERFVRRNPASAFAAVLLMTLAVVSALAALRLRQQRNEANENLGQSYLAQANAQRLSGRVGRRTESLKAIAAAARMRPSLELRNEAIAALALLDLGPPVQWRKPTPGTRLDLVVLDPQFERYAVFGEHGGVTLHRAQDSQVLAEFPTPANPRIRQRIFSADGRYLAAVFAGGRVHVWNSHHPAAAAQTNYAIVLETSRPLAFSPDSRTLAVAGRDRHIHAYDLSTGAERWQLNPGMSTQSLEFDPSGELLALGGGSEVQLWHAGRQERTQSLRHRTQETALAWHPEGRYLAVGYDSGDLLLWDSVTGQSRPLPGHAQLVSSLVFDPRGEFLASDSWDGTPRLWNAMSGRQLLETPDARPEISLDGRRLSYANESGEVVTREIIRSDVFRTLTSARTHHPQLTGLDVSRDSQWLAFSERGGWHLWDLARQQEVAMIPFANASRPAFHPEGRHLVMRSRDQILRWPLERSNPAGEVRVGPVEVFLSMPGSEFQTACFSSDGEVLAVAGHQRSLLTDWRNPTQQVAFAQQLRQSDISLSPDKRLVAVASYHGIGATVWNAHDGTLLRHLITNENSVVTFSPEGRTLATTTPRECVFWDTRTWEARRRFALAHAGEVAGPIAFSQDGELFAVAATRHDIRLLHARTGREVATLSPPDRVNLTWLVFSSDGRYLAASTMVWAVHLWDLHALRRELGALNLDW